MNTTQITVRRAIEAKGVMAEGWIVETPSKNFYRFNRSLAIELAEVKSEETGLAVRVVE